MRLNQGLVIPLYSLGIMSEKFDHMRSQAKVPE